MAALDRTRQRERPIVLSAGFPGEDEKVMSEELLQIEEALLSAVRAALAHGHPLVLPGDPVVAPLVAETAREYAYDARTERVERPQPLVHVLLTEGGDRELTEAIGGLEHVEIHGAGEERGHARRRHRLTGEALAEIAPPAAGIFFGGAPESLGDFEAVRMREIPLYVIGTALAGPLRESDHLRKYDVVKRVVGELEWGAEPHDVTPDAERSVPYPYVMQRLVAGLGEG